MFKLRENYGTALMHRNKSLPAWPRPHQLMKANPANIRKLGPTLRKGQYLVGLANDIVAGNVDMDFLMTCEPSVFYDEITDIKGIGPTSGQDLMMMRARTDAVFPSVKKSGEEKGLRRWITWSYGEDPHNTSEERFQELIQNWKGYEAAALEFLYANYVLKEKEEQAKK